ncbi:MAG: DUF4286 family protein, partial [Legionella longbeachae]|nr:DUF4286 family protein [Legionella longbeachae]
MVIYEVNLVISGNIYPEFQLWLKKHVKEIVQIQGFVQASILKPENDKISDFEKLTVQYLLENREYLNVYFMEFAAKMREEGIKLFKDKFSADRRI